MKELLEELDRVVNERRIKLENYSNEMDSLMEKEYKLREQIAEYEKIDKRVFRKKWNQEHSVIEFRRMDKYEITDVSKIPLSYLSFKRNMVSEFIPKGVKVTKGYVAYCWDKKKPQGKRFIKKQ